MIDPTKLREAIEQLPVWRNGHGTSITWVNWRNGYQIKMGWNDSASFHCYIDFGKDYAARESILAAAFACFSDAGDKPTVEHGHGWSKLDHSFHTKQFISVNEVAELAQAKGITFSIIYCQSCIGSRPIFETMGIPLVPGEMGKEWINGEFIPYSCPSGKCL